MTKYIDLKTLGEVLEARGKKLVIHVRPKGGSWAIPATGTLDDSTKVLEALDKGSTYRTPKIDTYTRLSSIDECMVMQGLEREIHFHSSVHDEEQMDIQGCDGGWVLVSDEPRLPEYFKSLLGGENYRVRVVDL